MDTERSLAALFGLIFRGEARSTELSANEEDCSRWLSQAFFAGGLQLLQPQNPFDEEKGESRTPSSCTTTPGTQRLTSYLICPSDVIIFCPPILSYILLFILFHTSFCSHLLSHIHLKSCFLIHPS